MQRVSRFTFLIVFLSIAMSSLAQSDTTVRKRRVKVFSAEGNIEQQFDEVIKKSNQYQANLVVRKSWILQLKSNVSDTISMLKKDLIATNSQVVNQNDEIDVLKSKLKSANDDLAKVNKQKDSVNFLGMQMGKAAYKGLMWAIIAGLAMMMGYFLYRFKRSNVVTVETKKSLTEVQEEFESYRKRALEREQSVRRELQNYLNKKK